MHIDTTQQGTQQGSFHMQGPPGQIQLTSSGFPGVYKWESKDRDVENHTVGWNSKLLKARDRINVPRGKKWFSGKEIQKILQVSWTVNWETSIPFWSQQLLKIWTLSCVHQSFHISPLHLHTGKTTHSIEGEGRGAIMINKTLILFTSILRRSYLTLSISAPNEEQNAVTLKSTALLLAFFHMISHTISLNWRGWGHSPGHSCSSYCKNRLLLLCHVD